MRISPSRYIPVATCVVALLFVASLFWGSVRIPFGDVFDILTGRECDRPSWAFIVLESRLPQAITALAVGASLAAAGLMLQTVFGNPLAGPSVLGIDAGASLGVALVMLSLGGTGNLVLGGYLAVVAGAFVGASVVLGIVIFF